MKRLVTALLGAMLCLAVAACHPSGGGGGEDQKTTFNIAFNTWLGYSPLLIAKEKGFLAKRGLDVNITFLEGIGEKNAALLRGDIDGVGHTADSAVTSAAAGVDGQIVYVFDESYGADGILASNDVRTIADLKGKKVALEPGFTGHFFLLSLLEEANLSPSDIQPIAMDTGSAGGAFLAKRVDAAATWEPWIGKAKERADGHVLVTSRDKPGRIIDVLYMNRATIAAHPAEIGKLVDAMDEAIAWYRTHVDEGDRIMAKFWKLPLPEEKTTVAGMRFFDRAANAKFFGTAAAPGQLLQTVTTANRVWARAGVIKKPIGHPERLIYYDGVTR
ncbi:MAG TPA: ABC transporter substrate-binding protein [Allosphingosinicella sp.]